VSLSIPKLLNLAHQHKVDIADVMRKYVEINASIVELHARELLHKFVAANGELVSTLLMQGTDDECALHVGIASGNVSYLAPQAPHVRATLALLSSSPPSVGAMLNVTITTMTIVGEVPPQSGVRHAVCRAFDAPKEVVNGLLDIAIQLATEAKNPDSALAFAMTLSQ
jgi:hypothetical protein